MIMLLIKLLRLIATSLLLIILMSFFKEVCFIKSTISFLNIAGTLLIADSLIPFEHNPRKGLIERLRWTFFEQSEFGQPIQVQLFLLYIGLGFILIANLISLLTP
jgi:hypothetical protein